MRTNGTLNYLLGDHLGSTSLTTNASGQIVSELRYKAWGETRYASGTTPTKYTYTGQYSYASDFGLHFYNARWYDSSLGRFAQADSIVPSADNVQAWDRYSYANNAPLKYSDPTGHCGEDSSPAPGISQEQHDNLCALHDEALRLSSFMKNGDITDVDALVQLMEFGADLYSTSFEIFGQEIILSEDKNGFVEALGIVVGGIEITGTPLEHGLNRLRGEFSPEDTYELLNDPDNPMSQYYVGYSAFTNQGTTSGLAEEFVSGPQNQLRHFLGGVAGGYAFFGLGRTGMLRDEREVVDQNLYRAAFEFADHLSLTTNHVTTASDWVRDHLAK